MNNQRSKACAIANCISYCLLYIMFVFFIVGIYGCDVNGYCMVYTVNKNCMTINQQVYENGVVNNYRVSGGQTFLCVYDNVNDATNVNQTVQYVISYGANCVWKSNDLRFRENFAILFYISVAYVGIYCVGLIGAFIYINCIMFRQRQMQVHPGV